MKPLIATLLIALAAGHAAAQISGTENIVNAAREERARQAKISSARVFSDANAHSPEAAAEPAKPAAVDKATPTATAPEDPAAALQEQIRKLRARVVELQDQETSLKLAINDATNQVFAPVTDAGAHNDALVKMADTQNKLADVQKDLAQTRTTLLQLEASAQAAPK
jgi:chromosome segregation ATPase